MTSQLPKTTARFGRVSVRIALAMPDEVPAMPKTSTTARTVGFSAPVRLRADDLWAALWYGRHALEWPEEFEDLAAVREIVADSLVNGGLENAVNQAHTELAGLEPGTEEHVWAAQLRDIACQAFALAPAGRGLVGVA